MTDRDTIEMSAEWPGRIFFAVIMVIVCLIVIGIYTDVVQWEANCHLQWVASNPDTITDLNNCVEAMKANGVNYFHHRLCAERLSEVQGFKCQ